MRLNTDENPYQATIGLRIEPGAARLGASSSARPCRPRTCRCTCSAASRRFAAAIEKHVRRELGHGWYGWEVTDCVVTMTEAAYSVADGPPSKRGPTSTSLRLPEGDPDRGRRALDRARTRVCEPVLRVFLEVPTDDAARCSGCSDRWGAELAGQTSAGEFTRLEARLRRRAPARAPAPAARPDRRRGSLESRFDGYQPVRGRPPVRRGTP